jgi:MbtH protein
MANPFESDDRVYIVLVNEERQYSLWPADHNVPAGWSATGTKGSRKECLDWVDQNWVDMRPYSLVKSMEAAGS